MTLAPAQHDAVERQSRLVLFDDESVARRPRRNIATMPILEVGLGHQQREQAKVDAAPAVTPPQREAAVAHLLRRRFGDHARSAWLQHSTHLEQHLVLYLGRQLV